MKTMTIQQVAIECAAAVLPIWEAKYPDDMRPRKAIEAAKEFLAGKLDSEMLRAFVSAAADAADAGNNEYRCYAAACAASYAAASAAADALTDAAAAADAAADAAGAVYINALESILKKYAEKYY